VPRRLSAVVTTLSAAVLTAFLLTSTSLAEGSRAGGVGAAAAKSQITVGLPSAVPPFDPQKYDSQYLRSVTDNINEPLLGRSGNGKLIPVLATAMPKAINATTWQFKLRKGIKFSNGQAFDARSAAYSISRIINPTLDSELLSLVNTIKSAQAVGRYTLNVKTDGRDVLVPARMPIIKMLPSGYAEKSAFLKHPIGTGPYIYVSGSGLGPIVLKKNPHYWGGNTATIATIRIRSIPDVTTRVAALRAGEVNLITVLPPDSVKSVPKVATAVGIENPTVIFNSGFGITKDKRVRKALNLAVDKRAIAKNLFNGYASVSRCQPLSPSAFGYNAALKPYAYNPSQARSMLRAAGAEGQSITLVTSDVFSNGPQLAQVIASYWTAVGLKVNVQVPPFKDYLTAFFAKGDQHPDGVYVSTSSDLVDASSTERMLSSKGDRSGAYANATVDRLFETAAQTPNAAKRKALYARLLKTACDDASVLALINPKDLYGTSKNLRWKPRFDLGLHYSTMRLAK
jgi:peptide/nickel transport system substrate-binding protein